MARLLPFDHLFDPFAVIAAAGVFHTVGRDDKERVLRYILGSCVLVDVADVVDCASNRIQQGGAAAHTILPISHGLDVSDINAVMDHFADIVKEDSGDQRFAGSLLECDRANPAFESISFNSSSGNSSASAKAITVGFDGR
mgnify:CR=1 FL=1